MLARKDVRIGREGCPSAAWPPVSSFRFQVSGLKGFKFEVSDFKLKNAEGSDLKLET
jgi:hypothetical protein